MSDIKELKDKLFLNRKNGRTVADDETLNLASDYAEGYKKFLDNAKTEREAVKTAIKLAEDKGFVPFQIGKDYKAGDKVYFNTRGKTVAFAAEKAGVDVREPDIKPTIIAVNPA